MLDWGLCCSKKLGTKMVGVTFSFAILEDQEGFGAINRSVKSRFPNHDLLGLNSMDLDLIG